MQKVERYLDYKINLYQPYDIEELFNPNPARDLVIGRIFYVNPNDLDPFTITIQKMDDGYAIYIAWPSDPDEIENYHVDNVTVTIYDFIDLVFDILYPPRRVF